MFDMLWPLVMVVASNTLYQICAKSVPAQIDPLASVGVTYLVGAAISLILYHVLGTNPNLPREYTHLNWAPFALGIAVVGLEVGNIYCYKNGWPISAQSIVQGVIVAILLVFVGYLLYHEQITVSKLAGIAICMLGLYFINR